MNFPFIKGTFLISAPGPNGLKSLIKCIEHDTDLNAKLINISERDISFSVRPSVLFERNSFLPDVHIFMQSGTVGAVEYSLKKSTQVFLFVYLIIALIFELILLAAIQSFSPFLLIPLGLILFASAISFCCLYVFSVQVHRKLLFLMCATMEQSLRIAIR